MGNGFLFGVVLVATLTNLAYGLPAILSYTWLILAKNRLPSQYVKIFVLLMIKILWMTSINISISNKSSFSLLQTLAPDVIFFLMLFVSVDRGFLNGMFRVLIFLFLVDFSFNLSIYLFGSDPLGRGAGLRSDDFLPRVGGLFGHPFYSVNIAIVALVSAIFLSKPWVVFLATIGVLMNGTLRAPLTLLVVFVIFLLLKLRVRFSIIIIFLLAMAIAVFGLTIYSASSADYISGNFLRVVAWTNAVKNIIDNPVFGTHTFLPGSFDEMSVDAIIDYGIAESAYLQYGLDFGLLPVAISIYIFLFFSKIGVNSYYRSRPKGLFLASAILSSVVFADMFYGTFFGSVLTSFFYCAVCVSFDRIRHREFTSRDGQLLLSV